MEDWSKWNIKVKGWGDNWYNKLMMNGEENYDWIVKFIIKYQQIYILSFLIWIFKGITWTNNKERYTINKLYK